MLPKLTYFTGVTTYANMAHTKKCNGRERAMTKNQPGSPL